MSTRLSIRDIVRLEKSFAAQGARVDRNARKGTVKVRTDTGMFTIHQTARDYRNIPNLRAAARRCGLTWPD